MQSRRAVLVSPGKFELQMVDVVPSAKQLLVKVTVCGLCNWELNHWRGHLGSCPQTLGHEMGGTVVGMGDQAEGFAIGDVVTGYAPTMCGFSDYIVFDTDRCVKVEPGIDPVHAFAEPLKCIVTVLKAAAPECGDFGVIVGCGPMGLWCIQALSGKLLSGLIAVDIDPRRLELAKQFGATHIIQAGVENVEEKIRAISDGHMADFVIEGTGNPGVVSSTVAYLKTGRGRLILMSSYEAENAPFNLKMAMEKSIEVRVAHPSYSSDPMDDMRRAVSCLNRGIFKMDGVVSHVFKLEDIQKAFEALEHKPDGYLKGIVIP